MIHTSPINQAFSICCYLFYVFLMFCVVFFLNSYGELKENCGGGGGGRRGLCPPPPLPHPSGQLPLHFSSGFKMQQKKERENEIERERRRGREAHLEKKKRSEEE